MIFLAVVECDPDQEYFKKRPTFDKGDCPRERKVRIIQIHLERLYTSEVIDQSEAGV